ncbi:MAG: ribosome maturation factor RimM [Neisseriaceae bacterium]
MSYPSDLVEMGFLKRAVGLKGWLEVKASTQTPNSLSDYPLWFVGNKDSGFRCLELEDSCLQKDQLRVKFREINNRTNAEALRGLSVAVSRAAFSPTSEGEFYWCDLIGLEVFNQHQYRLGTVDSLMQTGANDVLVVRSAAGKQILIPFVDLYVQEVELVKKRINVTWDWDD